MTPRHRIRSKEKGNRSSPPTFSTFVRLASFRRPHPPPLPLHLPGGPRRPLPQHWTSAAPSPRTGHRRLPPPTRLPPRHPRQTSASPAPAIDVGGHPPPPRRSKESISPPRSSATLPPCSSQRSAANWGVSLSPWRTSLRPRAPLSPSTQEWQRPPPPGPVPAVVDHLGRRRRPPLPPAPADFASSSGPPPSAPEVGGDLLRAPLTPPRVPFSNGVWFFRPSPGKRSKQYTDV